MADQPAKDDLVERLRGECRDYTGEMIDPRSTTREEVHCSLLYEAATRITELQAQLKEAREALKPFGEAFEKATSQPLSACLKRKPHDPRC